MNRLTKMIRPYVAAIILFIAFAPPCLFAEEPLFASLESRLIKDGVDEKLVHTIYQHPDVKLEPRILAWNLQRSEKTLDYSQFLSEAVVSKGKQYSEHHRDSLKKAQEHFGVRPSIIVAILLIETQLGGNTGRFPTVNILSTMATCEDPQVQEKILSSFKERPSKEEFQRRVIPRLSQRAKRGYRDLKALLLYASSAGLDPLTLKGSLEGAIGIPQFLPSNISYYGCDGEGDGVIDLFSHADAIASVASFLNAHRWNVRDEKAVLLCYNRSSYYVDTVLALARKLE